MAIPSLEFLLALLLLVTAFHLIPTATGRRWLLTACNAAFIFWSLPNYASLIAMLLFALSGFAVARVLQQHRNSLLLWIYLTLLIVAFMVLKKYAIIGLVVPQWIMRHPLSAVGLSYMLFRQIHFVIDVMQEQIQDFTLLAYLNYQFNLFGFISGPIQRYQDFAERWQPMTPLLMDRHEILRAWQRLFIGAIKISIISNFFIVHFESQRPWFMTPRALDGVSRLGVLARFATVFYSYPLYLYFNFSGYCDVVIAAGALVGLKLPENFDRPYLARNVSDYWTRFHQSLGFWIRDYLFTPMYKAAITRWSSSAMGLVFPCYLIAFVIAGVWHGNTLNFLVFGLLHGLGVCAGKLWENWIIRRRGRKGLKGYLASPTIRLVAIVTTLNFVAVTMLFFPSSVSQTMAMLRTFGHHVLR